ncbi:hypothetical protein CP335_09280 [Pseudomonas fluorescens]|uniref:Uncharacterized protein n=1 Tax=Pseudomonas fluorescens TaxID=294 RepID=A0A854XFZ6_PSEFL|nr:hypothetical protein CP335_09280 [Pseudomonas fluorescens]
MVGSPGKRAMLADMWDGGQCGVGEIIFICGMWVARADAIASRLAPTIGMRTPCRSEPARDGGRPVDEDPELVYTCGELRHRQKVRTIKSAVI